MIAVWKPLGLQAPTVVAVCGSMEVTASVMVVLKPVAFSQFSFRK
ncbi:uncharacterized protein METZ01_LOCUS46024 [marine metagenome]|jgi:hypothetical protein|uniref:Uncharacterized protein n=1 Tax=marine metagenome TaxID=408172 RepID=A0A381RMS1_9ZZZZ|tara:strand:- start:5724 stop:5858 length:135 start_codon:yes stop_codon:yes gene_type:complete